MKPKPIIWTPRRCPVTAACFPNRSPSCPNRDSRSFGTCCADASNWWPKGCRNVTDWVETLLTGRSSPTECHIAWPDQEIAQVDREYQEVLKRPAPLNQRASLYRTVPGVRPITAATLVAELPELGNWDPKALDRPGRPGPLVPG